MNTSYEQIEVRAYELWKDRGEPLGTPDIDWLNAEKELTATPEDGLSSLARKVGTALGTVVALLTDDPHER